MKEIEVKILEIDINDIERKLIALGAKKIFDGIIDSLIFDFEDASLKKDKKLLRLRKNGQDNLLTFKIRDQTATDTKTSEEIELGFDNFENMKLIFENLGLKPNHKYVKHRISYQIDDVHFELERLQGEYSFIPEFMEIEGPNPKTIFKFAEKLGFSKDDCKDWGGRKLIRYYQEKD